MQLKLWGGLSENKNVNSALAGLGLRFQPVLRRCQRCKSKQLYFESRRPTNSKRSYGASGYYAICNTDDHLPSYSFFPLTGISDNLLYVKYFSEVFGICQQTLQTHIHDILVIEEGKNKTENEQ